MKIEGKLVDIHNRSVYGAEILIEGQIIKSIKRRLITSGNYILPGLIDAHVHIESSMVTPGSFAKASVPHGTTAVISDPHEIANVLGERGVEYMIEDGLKTPFKFYFGAPSCVPATTFESSGAYLGVEEVKRLLEKKEIRFLAEMMNYPGVINDDREVIEKIDYAKNVGKPVDGHAPGLRGKDLRKYISAGITTDHECSSMEEAREKIALGMKVIIREGSAGRNLAALKELYAESPEMIMLSSDDIHPEMLMNRHLDKLIGGLINDGYDMFNVIRSVTLNPVEHYKINSGLLREGDPADFIVVGDLRKMDIHETWINGVRVFDGKNVLFDYCPGEPVNNFNSSTVSEQQIRVRNENAEMRVIASFDGELFTKEIIIEPQSGTYAIQDTGRDILKIVIKDRYHDAPPAAGFIRGFGLKAGAFASSVAHDSHNIISIGTNDKDIVSAVNEIVKLKGGLAVSNSGKTESLQLNIGGIMSASSCSEIAEKYEYLSAIVKKLGCTMSAPFMTLSFMALLVIPELKMSDSGLFDGTQFKHVDLFVK